MLKISVNPHQTSAHMTPQHTMVAPPVSIASISASVYGLRRNLAGSSLRSKNSPWAAATGPKSRPGTEPTELSVRMLRPRGPCCCACWRYAEKEGEPWPGRAEDGEAGWTEGVWSTDAGVC